MDDEQNPLKRYSAAQMAAWSAYTWLIVQAYYHAGYSIIPIEWLTKEPIVYWEEFQNVRASLERLADWFRPAERKTTPSIGIVMGFAGEETIDFDDASCFPGWAAFIQENQPNLWDKICINQTGRGYHVCFRSPFCGPNQVIASRFDRVETGKLKKVKLIETRGIGGCIVAPGSPPWTHKTGNIYQHRYCLSLQQLARVAPLTSEERTWLFAGCLQFDQPRDEMEVRASRDRQRVSQIKRSFDSCQFADSRRIIVEWFQQIEWDDILEPYGWTPYSQDQWTRPGKKTGCSASVIEAKDGEEVLHIFTSDGDPLEHQQNYSKFAAYAILWHDGDFKAAARTVHHLRSIGSTTLD